MKYYRIKREDGLYVSISLHYHFVKRELAAIYHTRGEAESRMSHIRRYPTNSKLTIEEFWEVKSQEGFKPVMLPTNDPVLCDYLEERGYKEAAEILREESEIEPFLPQKDHLYLLYTPTPYPWEPFNEIIPRWDFTPLRRFGGIIS